MKIKKIISIIGIISCVSLFLGGSKTYAQLQGNCSSVGKAITVTVNGLSQGSEAGTYTYDKAGQTFTVTVGFPAEVREFAGDILSEQSGFPRTIDETSEGQTILLKQNYHINYTAASTDNMDIKINQGTAAYGKLNGSRCFNSTGSNKVKIQYVSASTTKSVADRNKDCNVTTITAENVGHVNGPDSSGNCCYDYGVVIAGLSPCTAAQMGAGNACTSPIGSVSNGITCECPTGTKNVKGTCTSCKADGVCCGIELNTSVPFIGKCIEDDITNRGPDETAVTGETAFPVLMSSLTKILVTIILIVSFVLIIIGGIMIATGNPSGGKKMIIKVVVGIALLGASGVILRLINPNFFG